MSSGYLLALGSYVGNVFPVSSAFADDVVLLVSSSQDLLAGFAAKCEAAGEV